MKFLQSLTSVSRKRPRYFCALILLFILTGCGTGVAAPDAVGSASPEAIALSLSTIDPEEYIHLFEYDRGTPLDIQEEHRWREGNATWIDFTYASPDGGRVPTRLVIPDGRGPFPGIVLAHGGPGTLEDMVDFTRAFTSYGAVTIAITNPYGRPGGMVLTEYMGNTWPIFTERDLEFKIQLIKDLQRSVDILLERPEVDPDRLAYFGVSFGGAMGGLLAGVEERLVAYVLVVGDGGLVEHTSDPGEDGLNIHFSENWAALMWPTEPLHFVGRAAPAALLFQNGLHDTFTKPADAIRFQTAASEPKTVIWYDSDHNLPWSFVHDSAKWLQPYLGGRLLLLAPNYHASAVIFDRLIIISALLALGIFVLDIFKRKTITWGECLVWLPGIVFLGPIGLALYWFTKPRIASPTEPVVFMPTWKRVLGITALNTNALITMLFIGDQVNDLLLIADFRLRFLQLYLTLLLGGWLMTTLARDRYRITVSSQILVTNLFWVLAMIYPATLKWVASTPYWLLYTVETLLGILITYPIHAWMLARGLERGHPLQGGTRRVDRSDRYVIIGLLSISFIAVLGSVFLVVKLYTQLSWREVILIMRGIYF